MIIIITIIFCLFVSFFFCTSEMLCHHWMTCHSTPLLLIDLEEGQKKTKRKKKEQNETKRISY